MNKTKKALLGTALAGAVVVGAGFGTFSWFTSSAEVTGSVENSTLKISAGEDANFDLTVDGDNYSALAPGRTASGIATIENTGDEVVVLTGEFDFTLSNIVAPLRNTDTVATLSGYDVEVLVDGESVFGGPETSRDRRTAAHLEDVDVLEDFVLASGDIVEVELKVSLDGPTTGNEYQGAELSVDFEAFAKQTDEGAQFTNN